MSTKKTSENIKAFLTIVFICWFCLLTTQNRLLKIETQINTTIAKHQLPNALYYTCNERESASPQDREQSKTNSKYCSLFVLKREGYKQMHI